MATWCWLTKVSMKERGSAMLMVLGLLTFILALGSIVFHSAEMREELARERYAYRKTMNVLESITTAACAAGSSLWKTYVLEHPEAIEVATYTFMLDGISYLLDVKTEQGELIMRASCNGKFGLPLVLKTRLSFEGERAVIREQKRSL